MYWLIGQLAKQIETLLFTHVFFFLLYNSLSFHIVKQLTPDGSQSSVHDIVYIMCNTLTCNECKWRLRKDLILCARHYLYLFS